MQHTAADSPVGLTDQLLVIRMYREWKAACAEVSAAYGEFCNAAPPARTVAFAAYRAALDREEATAHSYASQVMGLTAARTGRRHHARR
jgi:hypothetical protein